MRRFAAAFAFIFVASLMLVAYGHCWPMLVEEIAKLDAPPAHDHSGHSKMHHHPTEGFGQELSVPGVASGAVAVIDAPIAKSFAPVLLVVEIADHANPDVEGRFSHSARAGPPAFQEFHARTGRLLI